MSKLLINGCSKAMDENGKEATDLSPKYALRAADNTKSEIIDFSRCFLTLERGPLHYDKFVLEDTIITFYPSSESFISDPDSGISANSITPLQRNAFFSSLMQKGVLTLKDAYPSDQSCNSLLKITLQFDDITKHILCEDFKNGCPELLQFVEKQIVFLHGSKLERTELPG